MYVVSKPIKEFDEIFKEYNFCRISRKFLINPNNVIELDTSDKPKALLINNMSLRITKNKLQEFEEKFYDLQKTL